MRTIDGMKDAIRRHGAVIIIFIIASILLFKKETFIESNGLEPTITFETIKLLLNDVAGVRQHSVEEAPIISN